MDFLWFILVIILVFILGVISFQLARILEKLRIIIMNQEEFDNEIAKANQSLDDIAVSITNETQEIKDFIASLPPNVDTSTLDGVVTRLGSVSAAISEVFTAPEV